LTYLLFKKIFIVAGQTLYKLVEGWRQKDSERRDVISQLQLDKHSLQQLLDSQQLVGFSTEFNVDVCRYISAVCHVCSFLASWKFWCLRMYHLCWWKRECLLSATLRFNSTLQCGRCLGHLNPHNPRGWNVSVPALVL